MAMEEKVEHQYAAQISWRTMMSKLVSRAAALSEGEWDTSTRLCKHLSAAANHYEIWK